VKPSGSDGPHVFVDDLDLLELRASDWAHLTGSLRLRAGDRFTASDGRGSWRVCRVGRGGDLVVEPDGEVIFVEAPQPQLSVGFALIKGGRPELITQKLTELGIDQILPFVSERSVVRWAPDRQARNIERLGRVARSAAMQSRQVRLPQIGLHADQLTEPTEGLADFATLAAGPSTALADIGGEPISLSLPRVLVGPEGGWSVVERAQLPAVCLGDSVLRSETAAITAGALLAAARHKIIF